MSGRVFVLLVVGVLVLGGCEEEGTRETDVVLLPEIRTFLAANPEYGEVLSVGEAPPWAAGPRQAVATSTGSYVLYVHERVGEVTGVWKQTEDGGLTQIWSKEVPEEPADLGERMASEGLPDYEVIDEVTAIGGDKFGDILIASLSRDTPEAEREQIARGIAAGEGYDVVVIYCSREAQQADYSASFAEAHPGVLEECALGKLEAGRFDSYDALYR